MWLDAKFLSIRGRLSCSQQSHPFESWIPGEALPTLNDKPDSETRARVNGIDSQMKTFDFYFGVCLLHNVLSHTDNLSKTLQHTTFSAAEGQRLVRMTTTTLQSIRSEEMFKLFCQ